jgi:hypothetical protein
MSTFSSNERPDLGFDVLDALRIVADPYTCTKGLIL